MNPPANRFTLDGSERLEQHLTRACSEVRQAVQSLIPQKLLDALVLGGGYGRGEGGVFRTNSGDLPYNDLEFYVFVRGNRLLAQRKYSRALEAIAAGLSPWAGLHIEFKVESLPRLRAGPVSMFSYDLIAGHHVILGSGNLFAACSHHLQADRIPLSEATRLLFNRCSGLLFAAERLRTRALDAEQSDFIGRNIWKARLAFGDAVLTAFAQYHWSCRERHQRLLALAELRSRSGQLPPGFDKIAVDHSSAVEFKLHPHIFTQTKGEFEVQHEAVCQRALELWLWLESRRLNRRFSSPDEYASALVSKCPESAGWRNYLLNLRTFGVSALANHMAGRYPRERLLNSLSLLLWNREWPRESETVRHLQQQLVTDAADWPGLVAAYKKFWPSYG